MLTYGATPTTQSDLWSFQGSMPIQVGIRIAMPIYFTALPSNRLIKAPDWIKGATHTDELNYVFMFDDELNRMVEDKQPFADWEFELSYRMVTYWTNFAKSG